MSVAIIDYGVGNLFSLASSLHYLGVEAKVTAKAADLQAADRLILPGVGAFGDAAAKLRESGLLRWCANRRRPASRCWVFAWACSCCLIKAWNMANTLGWA